MACVAAVLLLLLCSYLKSLGTHHQHSTSDSEAYYASLHPPRSHMHRSIGSWLLPRLIRPIDQISGLTLLP